MTFNQLWASLCKKQPKLEQEEASVEFKSKNLKALLKQVYEQGEKRANDLHESQKKVSSLFDNFR